MLKSILKCPALIELSLSLCYSQIHILVLNGPATSKQFLFLKVPLSFWSYKLSTEKKLTLPSNPINKTLTRLLQRSGKMKTSDQIYQSL